MLANQAVVNRQLVRCCLRFYDASEGEVLIDGTNIEAYKLQDLRKQRRRPWKHRTNSSAKVKEEPGTWELDVDVDNDQLDYDFA